MGGIGGGVGGGGAQGFRQGQERRNGQAQGPVAPIGGLRSCFVQSRTYRWSDHETFGAILKNASQQRGEVRLRESVRKNETRRRLSQPISVCLLKKDNSEMCVTLMRKMQLSFTR
ncbi:hypothetical protein Tco_0688482 [Tanacetum coccineum]